MVTTVGAGDTSGSIPLVKWTTSASTWRSAVDASVCIQTSRGTPRGGVATRTRGGSGAVVSMARLDRTISSSLIAVRAR